MFNFFLEQRGGRGAGGLAPQFRALVAPSEDWSWVPSIHSRSSQTPETGSEDLTFLASLGTCTYMHIHTQIHTHTPN